MKSEEYLYKIQSSLQKLSRNEARIYITGLQHGLGKVAGMQENSSGITFIFRNYEVWVGNFNKSGNSVNIRNLNKKQ